MKRIIIGKSGQCNIEIDVDVLLRTRLLIQANSGGGKSFLLRRIAEQLFGIVQVVIVDPEGEFATLREKYGYVLVGEGGETPADPRSAVMVAEKLMELRASAVCDLFEAFRKNPQGRHAWVRAFCNGLLDSPKKYWHPVVVIVDEFHKFCPEKGAGESEASEAVIGIGTAGRKRGICLVGATQRLGKVRKDVSAEMLNRLVGPTFEDVDVERAADLLSVRKEDRKDFYSEMRVLEPGNFYAFGRAISKERILVKIGSVQTTHPEMGSSKYSSEPPPPPEKIKALLPKLKDLPKQAEEKARTEAELKSEIRSLKAQLRSQPTGKPTEVKVADPKAIERAIRETATKFTAQMGELQRTITKHQRTLKLIAEAAAQAVDIKVKLGPIVLPKIPAVKIQKEERNKSVPKKLLLEETHSRSEPVNGDLGGPHRRILKALAELKAIGKNEAPKEMVAAWAGYSPNGGAFNNPLGNLNTNRLIEYPQRGVVALTEAGLAAIGSAEAPDQEEIVERIEAVLPGPQWKILSVLIGAGGDEMSKEDLAQQAGYSPDGGAFNNPLGWLRTAGYIEYPKKGVVRACGWIFLE